MRDLIKLNLMKELIWRGFKTCSKGQTTRPLLRFARDYTKKNGYNSFCKDCRNKVEKKRRKNPEHKRKIQEYKKKNKARTKNSALLRLFGLTLEQYNLTLEKQNGVCAICKQPEPTGRSLAVDHCHKTGKFRGLLCTNCNLSMGNFGDNIDTLNSAILYLQSKENDNDS